VERRELQHVLLVVDPRPLAEHPLGHPGLAQKAHHVEGRHPFLVAGADFGAGIQEVIDHIHPPAHDRRDERRPVIFARSVQQLGALGEYLPHLRQVARGGRVVDLCGHRRRAAQQERQCGCQPKSARSHGVPPEVANPARLRLPRPMERSDGCLRPGGAGGFPLLSLTPPPASTMRVLRTCGCRTSDFGQRTSHPRTRDRTRNS